MFTATINYIAAIPDVVWSGLIASLITLSGVMLSNRSNTKRLILQLKHDAEQKERDRLNNLRRDVYLNCIEEASKVPAYFGKIPMLDPTTTSIGEGLADFISASAKVQMVSQPETANLTAELTTKYGEIFALLLEKASPIHDSNSTIKISGDLYQRNQSEIDRILAEMKLMNESVSHDEARYLALERSLENTKNLVVHFSEEREKAFQFRDEALSDYMQFLFQEMKKTMTLQNEVAACIKRELNIEFDADASKKSSESSYARMSAAVNRLNSYLDSEKER